MEAGDGGRAMRKPAWWTFDADLWCASCARETYGDKLDDPDATDREGNPLYPVYSWDESEFAGMPCGACDAVVA